MSKANCEAFVVPFSLSIILGLWNIQASEVYDEEGGGKEEESGKMGPVGGRQLNVCIEEIIQS